MELLQIKEEDLNPRYCMMSYEVAKKMVFKNLNIDYSTVFFVWYFYIV